MKNYSLNEGYQNSSNFFDKGIGSKVFIKNKKFIDLSFSAGCLLLGHNSLIFKKIIKDFLSKKISIFAAPNKQAVDFSRTLKKVFPQYSKFIFCNSGSESVMKTIRICNALTKKDLIISVSGSWHGSNDKTLFSINKNLKTIPLSDGLGKYNKKNIKFIPYNDIELSKKILNKYKNEISCIIIEPIQAGLPNEEAINYLKFLDIFSKKNKKILIFDEIITGLRTDCSSVQQIFNLNPDITTFGKALGGGFPIGIIAIKKNIENKIKKNKKKIFLGGTFSGNSIATYSGKITTDYLIKYKKKIFDDINRKSIFFLNSLKKIIYENKINASVYNFKSIFRIVFTKGKLKNRIQRDFFESREIKNIKLFKDYLFLNKIYYPSNGIIFLSHQTTIKDLKKIIKYIKKGLLKYFKDH